MLKIDFVARFSSRRGWGRIKDEYIRIATDRNCSWHVRPSWSWRKSIFHRDRAGIWRTFYLTLTENRRETKQVDHKRAVLAFRYRESSGAERSVGFLFFSFPWIPLPPIGLSDPCSHRRKNKTQVALSGHHRHHGTWSTRCCRYLPPIEDTYLSLVPRERNLLPLGTTATILPRSCPVRRVTSELRAGDRYNGCLARIQSVVLQEPPC